MHSDQQFAKYSTAAIAISALAGGIGAMSALLGAPVAEIVLGEMSAFALVVTFTLLIWAAIQDGKQPDRPAVDVRTTTPEPIARPHTSSRPPLHPQYAHAQPRPVGDPAAGVGGSATGVGQLDDSRRRHRLRALVGQTLSAQFGHTAIEVGLVKHHRRAACALRIEPDLNSEGAVEVPFHEPVHRPGLRSTAEEARVPADRSIEIAEVHLGQQAVDRHNHRHTQPTTQLPPRPAQPQCSSSAPTRRTSQTAIMLCDAAQPRNGQGMLATVRSSIADRGGFRQESRCRERRCPLMDQRSNARCRVAGEADARVVCSRPFLSPMSRIERRRFSECASRVLVGSAFLRRGTALASDLREIEACSDDSVGGGPGCR